MAQQPAVQQKKKYTAKVALWEPFKDRLQKVALDLKKDMGQVIEEQLQDFIEREELRMDREACDRMKAREG